MALATILKAIFSEMILVKIMRKMEKYLNLNENLLLDDLENGQSATWAIATMLCP